ncbi:nidogen-like domain-containing protein [Paraflavitalea speifideaquila]|uniref:nidogen-like domain-containing protein n=1 Tax=Paraflavitalea speifideaquila TaxID=3076558 RepID=UPI0028E62FCC|nr:nidogen-like domain-containing protein [Paraflavitalea speifideiaquila]
MQEYHIDDESSGQIYYKVIPTHLIVIWDRVGIYWDNDGRVNTFQVVIGVPGDPLLGTNNVLFNYGDMQWAVEPEWTGG